MTLKWTTVALSGAITLAGVACNRDTTSSEVQALQRTNRTLHLKGTGVAAEGDVFKFSEINYTIYENGRIDLHGDVSFKVPLIDTEIDIPFTRTYRTLPENVMSAKYKAVTTVQPLQIDRLAVDVVSLSEDQTQARAKAQLNRTFTWMDLFWGFDLLTLDLDLSGPIVGIARVEIKKGFVYYDAEKERVLPTLYEWENNDDDDDDGGGWDGGWDGGSDGGPVFFLATPSEVVERESNDDTKIHKEAILIFE